MGQRRYSARVIVTMFCDSDDNVTELEVAEQRWGRAPHLVTFHDGGPFPPSKTERDMIEAAVSSSLTWLVEDAWALDSGRML